MDWNNGQDIARRIKKTARHSADWYRRAARIGRIAAVFSLLCSLAVTGCDFWLGARGGASENPIAEIVPGSMTAHLYFRFVRYIAFLRDDGRIVLLAAFGALAVLSLQILLFVRVFRDRSMKGLALFIWFDAFVSCCAACLLMPVTEFMSLSAVAGTVLRMGLGLLLLTGHSGEKWGEWLFAADETLWAAEHYGWEERFNPLTLSEEDWEKIHEEYLDYLDKQEESK